MNVHLPKSDLRCLGNYAKARREAVIQAAQESGQRVVWRDKPDRRMPAEMAGGYGSIWSAERDLSEFWRVYRNIIGETSNV